jgi:hypothetical protein
MDTEPSLSADILLSSSFAQEQYITIPAQQLFHSPGIYMLQVSVTCMPHSSDEATALEALPGSVSAAMTT